MVSISGPIVNVLGATFTGSVQVALVGSAEQGIGTLVTKKIVTNGTLALELEPSAGRSYYSVLFTPDNGPAWAEKWIVPDSELEWTPSSLVVASTRTYPAYFPSNVTVFGEMGATSVRTQAVYSDALTVKYFSTSDQGAENTSPVYTAAGEPGLNDLLVVPIGYTGTLGDTKFNIKIDAADTVDTFSWGTGDSFTDGAEGVEITGEPQVLSDGVSITFLATTGHTLNDEWSFTARRPRTDINVDSVTAVDDINLSAESQVLFGAAGVTGSWRVARSGDDLVFQRYEGPGEGAWVTKTTMTALGS